MSPSGNVDSFNRGPLLDLSFGDLQFGNRDTTAIGDGAVAVGGSNSGPIASGQGSTAVNGDVRDSNIIERDRCRRSLAAQHDQHQRFVQHRPLDEYRLGEHHQHRDWLTQPGEYRYFDERGRLGRGGR
ncbi:Uncharacterised protein [Mycobacteroides abscessus subsp. abscessus]|nr:Uncharacterised protein [Mycobacteroides abscessus subsp. abscessus]